MTNIDFVVDTHRSAWCYLLSEEGGGVVQELSELAMGTYKHIGRMRSARKIGKDLADFYMCVSLPSSVYHVNILGAVALTIESVPRSTVFELRQFD